MNNVNKTEMKNGRKAVSSIFFPQEKWPRIAKNSRGKTLTALAAKGYNARLFNYIKSKIKKIFRRNQSTIDGNTDFFHIVTGILHGDTLAPYLFILCLNYVLQTSFDLIKENGFTLKKQEADNIPKKL